MDEELRYLTEHDIIDLPHIRQVIEMEKRKEILSRHPYPIWQGKNGKWFDPRPSNQKSLDFTGFLSFQRQKVTTR